MKEFDAMAPRVFPVVYLIASRTELLYAGSTNDFERRLAEHARRSLWFADAAKVWTANCSTLAAARQFEARLIADFRPVHNVQHLYRTDHPLLAGAADTFDLAAVTELRESVTRFLGADPDRDLFPSAAREVAKRMDLVTTVAQVTR